MNMDDLVNSTVFNTVKPSNKQALSVNDLGEDKDDKERITKEEGEVVEEDTIELSPLVQDVVNGIIKINMNNPNSEISEGDLSKQYLAIVDNKLKKVGELSKLAAVYKL